MRVYIKIFRCSGIISPLLWAFIILTLDLWKMHSSFLYEFILHPESLNFRLSWWHIMGVHIIISKYWNGHGGRWYKLFHIHHQPLSFQTLTPHHKAKLSWSAWFHGHMIVGCEEFWDVDKRLHTHIHQSSRTRLYE